MSQFVPIWNLGEAALWTAGGSDAKPQINWVAADPEGGALSAYRVVLWDTEAHALAYGATGILYDSTKTTGAPGFHNCDYGMVNFDQTGAEVWVTIEVWDDLDESTVSTPVAIEVCWGQAVYQANPGTGSSAWSFDVEALAEENAQVATIFRSCTAVDGGGTVGPWQTTIGAVTPRAYLNVAVRLATYEAGVNASLPGMTFTYSGAAQQPDHWTADASGDWALDPGAYRFGTRAYKCEVSSNSGDRYIYPFRDTAGDDIIVQPNTEYVFSIYVRTLAELGTDSSIRLEVWSQGGGQLRVAGSTTDAYDEGVGEITTTVDAQGGPLRATSDNTYAELWQRIHVHYTTQEGETRIRPMLRYVQGGSGSGDIFWVDATMWSEGRVLIPWAPGWVSPAVTIDSFGVAIDNSGGGTFRLRKADGTTVDQDDIIDTAVTGGDHGSLSGLGDDDHPQYATDSDLTTHSGNTDAHHAEDHAFGGSTHTGVQILRDEDMGTFSAGTSTEKTITWPTTFGDTSYSVFMTLQMANNVQPPYWAVKSKTATQVTFRIYNPAGSSQDYTADIMGIHD